jgi:hypothetical protein
VNSCVPQSTETFFQFELMGIWVSVKPQEVKLRFTWKLIYAIGQLPVMCKGEARTIGILVGVKEDIRAVVFVVTVKVSF